MAQPTASPARSLLPRPAPRVRALLLLSLLGVACDQLEDIKTIDATGADEEQPCDPFDPCNGVDDDEDGEVDEGYPDTDGDGKADCVDEETCDGVDNDGDGEVDEGYLDYDGDGVPDCDLVEDCNGVDDNFNGAVDEGYPDTDEDGVADCVDVEICDGLDNDGDGLIDEGDDADEDGTPDICDVEDCDCLDNDGDGLVDEDCRYEIAVTATGDDISKIYIDGNLVGSTSGWGGAQTFVVGATGSVHHVAAEVVDMSGVQTGFLAAIYANGQLVSATGDGSWWAQLGSPSSSTWTTTTSGMVAETLATCTWPGLAAFSGTGAEWIWPANCYDTSGSGRAYFVNEFEICPAVELCNGDDDDGDGQIDEGFTDTDGDGVADCVDVEDCDCVDNDGDGEIDESCKYELEVLGTGDDVATFYVDGNLVGSSSSWWQPQSYSVWVSGAVHHVAAQVSDASAVQAGFRAAVYANGQLVSATGDGTWFGASGIATASGWQTDVSTLSPATPASCDWFGITNLDFLGTGAQWLWEGDCADVATVPDSHYVAELFICPEMELCNGRDDDGDGDTDEGFIDTDGDGVADCVDDDCDGIDNDGDGFVDEDHADTDGDGLADCIDEEECDGVDNDGDGQIDEDFDADGDGIADCFDEETCYDLIDNDGDGDVDEDCWGDCPLPTQTLTCEVTLSTGGVKCSTGPSTSWPITLTSTSSGYVYTLDMSAWDLVKTDLNTKGPSNYAIHWANSPSNDAWGGDGGDFENDSEAFLYGTSVYAYGNQSSGTPYLGGANLLTSSALESSVALICDSYFGFTSPSGMFEHAGPEIFQIDGNEPDAENGVVNDQKLYVGVRRTVGSTSRTGTGVEKLIFTFGR